MKFRLAFKYVESGSGDPTTLESSDEVVVDHQSTSGAVHHDGPVPVFDSLRAAGKLDTDGFASDADLFAGTSLGAFPDAAARIRAWTMNQVRNPADILVSLKPGYYHGIESFRHIVDLAGTHGGLERSGSLGFAMATYPLAPATRLSDLIPAKLLPRGENAELVQRDRSPQPRPSEQSSSMLTRQLSRHRLASQLR